MWFPCLFPCSKPLTQGSAHVKYLENVDEYSFTQINKNKLDRTKDWANDLSLLAPFLLTSVHTLTNILWIILPVFDPSDYVSVFNYDIILSTRIFGAFLSETLLRSRYPMSYVCGSSLIKEEVLLLCQDLFLNHSGLV